MGRINKIIRKIKKCIRKPRYKQPQDKLIKENLYYYKKNGGKDMDIYNPKTFTEKLQWYKFFYKKKGLDHIVDKYLFKSYIKEKLGENMTIPLYGYWSSLEKLEQDWNKLPNEFVLKSTISSSAKNIIFIHDKTTVKFKQLKKELKKWLYPKNTMLDSFCYAYYNTVPGILAEQYLENISNQLFDYKIFCFDGKPFCTYVAQEHFSEKGSTITFYDMEWNKLDVQYGTHDVGNPPKPKHWKDMIEISKILSKGFPFIRVDFFDTEEQLYVAELTMYPGGGYTQYYPESFNEKMGDLFNITIQ